MTLIVETGVGIANAESYIAVVDADTYHANVGNTNWALLDTPTKEQCLRRATMFLSQRYRLKWQGLRVNSLQALDWPRWNVILPDLAYYNVILPTVIPVLLQQANALLAFFASTDDLNPVLTQNILSEGVGPLKVVYDPYSAQNKRYIQIDDMLLPYLTKQAGGGNIKLTRC
jgi:hypothetical protein